MLCLTRKVNEAVVINDNIVLRVEWVNSGKVKLTFDAPRDVPIFREEIWKAKQQENDE